MRQDMLEELFEEKYGEAEGDPESRFLRLADWFSGERTDDALYRLVQRLYDFSRSHSWPSHWLRRQPPAFRWPIRKPLATRNGSRAFWPMPVWL